MFLRVPTRLICKTDPILEENQVREMVIKMELNGLFIEEDFVQERVSTSKRVFIFNL